VIQYRDEVRSRVFPTGEQSYTIDEGLLTGLKSRP
jgi:hypothetical protein